MHYKYFTSSFCDIKLTFEVIAFFGYKNKLYIFLLYIWDKMGAGDYWEDGIPCTGAGIHWQKKTIENGDGIMINLSKTRFILI